MHLMDLIHSKLELFRLEQRYTRRRNRRSTFVSEATYVDGEYIYSPTSTYSAQCCATSSDTEEDRTNSMQNNRPREKEPVEYRASERQEVKKNSKRMSMLAVTDWRRGKEERKQEKRLSRVSVREIRWDDRS
jgi:hypothetical protein